MGAITPVSSINGMDINIILLMSTGVIAAEVCIFAPVTIEDYLGGSSIQK
jgi:hypothetical protein